MPDLIDWLIEQEPTFRKSRLPSLFSDLAVQKTTNPEGYAANVLAWESALSRAAMAGKLPSEQRLVVTASDELLNALASPQYGRPSGLGLVFDESIRSGKMLDLKDFESAEQSIYHHSWIPSPWTVLKWGLKQAGLAGGATYDKSGRLRFGQLVSVTALESMYRQVCELQTKLATNLTDRIMTREAFISELARLSHETLSKRDIDILLRYLARDKSILSYDLETVKFKSPGSDPPDPITSEDTTIANLKSLLASLESQVEKLNERISNLQNSARLAVENKNKTAALSALRSKKIAEVTLQQRTDTISQLEQVYSKIEQAVDQVQIVEVMQSSVSVLKGLNKKIGGVEKVEDVVEELREEMGKVDEVQQVLQEPLTSNAAIDEADVDNELEELEQEERRKTEEREAEATKKRLAELEATEKETQKQGSTEQAVEIEASLRNSMERLDKLKIDEGASVQRDQLLGEESSSEQRQAEKREQMQVPEQVS